MRGRTLSKTVTLITLPTDRKVPISGDELALYLYAHTYCNVEIELSCTKQDLLKKFIRLFVDALKEARCVAGIHPNSVHMKTTQT